MTITQSETCEVSNGGARQRRYLERKRQGVVCIVHVPVYCRDVEEMVTCNRLSAEDERNPEKISAAVETLVDDFTEAKLVPAN